MQQTFGMQLAMTLDIVVQGSGDQQRHGDFIQADHFALFFHWLVGLVAFLVILASDSYLEREQLYGRARADKCTAWP